MKAQINRLKSEIVELSQVKEYLEAELLTVLKGYERFAVYGNSATSLEGDYRDEIKSFDNFQSDVLGPLSHTDLIEPLQSVYVNNLSFQVSAHEAPFEVEAASLADASSGECPELLIVEPSIMQANTAVSAMEAEWGGMIRAGLLTRVEEIEKSLSTISEMVSAKRKQKRKLSVTLNTQELIEHAFALEALDP